MPQSITSAQSPLCRPSSTSPRLLAAEFLPSDDESLPSPQRRSPVGIHSTQRKAYKANGRSTRQRRAPYFDEDVSVHAARPLGQGLVNSPHVRDVESEFLTFAPTSLESRPSPSHGACKAPQSLFHNGAPTRTTIRSKGSKLLEPTRGLSVKRPTRPSTPDYLSVGDRRDPIRIVEASSFTKVPHMSLQRSPPQGSSHQPLIQNTQNNKRHFSTSLPPPPASLLAAAAASSPAMVSRDQPVPSCKIVSSTKIKLDRAGNSKIQSSERSWRPVGDFNKELSVSKGLEGVDPRRLLETYSQNELAQKVPFAGLVSLLDAASPLRQACVDYGPRPFHPVRQVNSRSASVPPDGLATSTRPRRPHGGRMPTRAMSVTGGCSTPFRSRGYQLEHINLTKAPRFPPFSTTDASSLMEPHSSAKRPRPSIDPWTGMRETSLPPANGPIHSIPKIPLCKLSQNDTNSRFGILQSIRAFTTKFWPQRNVTNNSPENHIPVKYRQSTPVPDKKVNQRRTLRSLLRGNEMALVRQTCWTTFLVAGGVMAAVGMVHFCHSVLDPSTKRSPVIIM